MEPHDPELGLPLQLQRESELHACLLSMVEQFNFCGTSWQEHLASGKFVGATFESTIHKVKKSEFYHMYKKISSYLVSWCWRRWRSWGIRGSWGRLYYPKEVNHLSQQFAKLKSVKSIMYKKYIFLPD